ncbi:squalene/phytoene synthase family protein [Candidatus Pelagibacter sp.]|nr:squalene/phytoene synthase family protein [Candidatus Pelagibacter sp.]
MTNQNYLSLYAKSFNWAGFFLPKQTYQKCSALYDFCRVIDNIADDKGSVELKENKFKNFENNFNNKNFDDPIIKNMWDLIYEFNISLKIIHDFLYGLNLILKKK